MFYINTQTLEFPITEGAIRTQFANTSFPVPFTAPAPYAAVQDTPAPEHDRLRERVQDAPPELVNGQWQRRYRVVPLDAETIAENEKAALDTQAALVRGTRNELLQQTDWTQVADAPVDQAMWATYRQALRDISKQTGFPWAVEWPVQPMA